MHLPTYDDVVEAARRLDGHALHTPDKRSRTANTQLGAAQFFKCENLQRTGAFKFRGAFNAGGADKNLDWFYAASPRLTRYSIGLRAPREILIRFSLYQRM